MAQNPTGFTVDAILCDSAAVADGKLYLLGGGWHMLGTTSFPFRQSRIGLGLVFGIPYTATNKTHKISIHLEGEDGQRISFEGGKSVSMERSITMGRPAMIQPGDAQTLPFALTFDQIQFEIPGAYSFIIAIDGIEVERLAFRVFSLATMLPMAG